MKSNVKRWGPFFIWRPYGYFIFGVYKNDQYVVLLSLQINEQIERQELRKGER